MLEIGVHPLHPSQRLKEAIAKAEAVFGKQGESHSGTVKRRINRMVNLLGIGGSMVRVVDRGQVADAEARIQKSMDMAEQGQIPGSWLSEYHRIPEVAGPEDYEKIAAQIVLGRYKPKFMDSVADISSQALPLAMEFAATGGAAQGARGLIRGSSPTLAKKVAGEVGAASTRWALLPHHFAENVHQRTHKGESIPKAIAKGFIDSMSEMLIEEAGGKVVNRLPYVKKAREALTTVVSKLTGKTGGALTKQLSRMGFHGVIGEVLEERISGTKVDGAGSGTRWCIRGFERGSLQRRVATDRGGNDCFCRSIGCSIPRWKRQ